ARQAARQEAPAGALPPARRARQGTEDPPPRHHRHAPRGLELLRPQRRGRRRARRGALRARNGRPPGEAAVDARGRVPLGAVRLGDGHRSPGRPRRERKRGGLSQRAVEPHPQHAPGRVGWREPSRCLVRERRAAPRIGPQHPAARGRRRPPRDPALPLPPAAGRGIGFAKYKNLATYVAVVAEVEVDRESGEVKVPRAWAAADAGLVVNPDGLSNQIEGGVIQSTSWTLREAVEFDGTRILTGDW